MREEDRRSLFAMCQSGITFCGIVPEGDTMGSAGRKAEIRGLSIEFPIRRQSWFSTRRVCRSSRVGHQIPARRVHAHPAHPERPERRDIQIPTTHHRRMILGVLFCLAACVEDGGNPSCRRQQCQGAMLSFRINSLWSNLSGAKTKKRNTMARTPCSPPPRKETKKETVGSWEPKGHGRRPTGADTRGRPRGHFSPRGKNVFLFVFDGN